MAGTNIKALGGLLLLAAGAVSSGQAAVLCDGECSIGLVFADGGSISVSGGTADLSFGDGAAVSLGTGGADDSRNSAVSSEPLSGSTHSFNANNSLSFGAGGFLDFGLGGNIQINGGAVLSVSGLDSASITAGDGVTINLAVIQSNGAVNLSAAADVTLGASTDPVGVSLATTAAPAGAISVNAGNIVVDGGVISASTLTLNGGQVIFNGAVGDPPAVDNCADGFTGVTLGSGQAAEICVEDTGTIVTTPIGGGLVNDGGTIDPGDGNGGVGGGGINGGDQNITATQASNAGDSYTDSGLAASGPALLLGLLGLVVLRRRA